LIFFKKELTTSKKNDRGLLCGSPKLAIAVHFVNGDNISVVEARHFNDLKCRQAILSKIVDDFCLPLISFKF
jgi:hypothetical protein